MCARLPCPSCEWHHLLSRMGEQKSVDCDALGFKAVSTNISMGDEQSEEIFFFFFLECNTGMWIPLLRYHYHRSSFNTTQNRAWKSTPEARIPQPRATQSSAGATGPACREHTSTRCTSSCREEIHCVVQCTGAHK